MSVLIEPPNLKSKGLRAFFTTRNCLLPDDNIDAYIAGRYGVSKENIFLPLQKHTDAVHVLESPGERVVADAVVTARKNIFIGVIVADCVPVLLYDSRREVIAAVHAGWRGTAKRILTSTIHAMVSHFHSEPRNISIAIGPSIRSCSYEVGEDVKADVIRGTGKGDYHRSEEDRHFIDLSSANRVQALSAGIGEGNIWQSEECTFCNPGKYYSYRYEGGSTGRQGGFIGMW